MAEPAAGGIAIELPVDLDAISIHMGALAPLANCRGAKARRRRL